MTETQKSPRILILGAGAIGAFYGLALAEAGAEVSVVVRSEYDIVKANGYALNSQQRGDKVFRPAQVLSSVEQYQGGSPDYLVVTLKVIDGLDRVSLMRSAVGPQTVIVLIENGVEIEDEIAQAFPDNELISCLAFIQVSRIAPGVIIHYAFDALTMGNFPQGVSNKCKQFSSMLISSQVGAPLTENVVSARWQKCLWNAPFNPVSVLGGPIDTIKMLNAPSGEQLIRDLMREVALVASATGNPVPEGLIDTYISSTKKAPPYKTSMALDWERGDPMEVTVILDNTLAAAKRVGVVTPCLQTVTTLIKMLQLKKSEEK